MRALQLAVVAVIALVQAGAAQATGVKTFKAWYAVCDNVRACVAFGFPDADADIGGYVRIARGGAAGAQPVVSLVITADDAPKASAWAVQIDGRPVPGLATLPVKAGDDGQSVQLSPPQGAALVEALREGHGLEVTGGGKSIFSLDLGGSAAALLWVDDQQQRVGTVTALGRKGDKPAAAVPAVPPAPVVRAATIPSQAGLPGHVPTAVRRARGRDCTAQPGGDMDAPLIARLAPGLVLWGPVCDQGAYSIGNTLMLGDEKGGALRPLRLPYPPGLAERDTNELADPEFEPKTATLSSFAKGRGIGDCGEVMSWVWDGKAFQLASAQVMTECHGVPMDDWPSLWATRAR
ncbi:DUF1176 domain-containing protein [Caulobacter sp. KR2-114]|uniref:DUF1176 domain-containing protein n=1 Tax=Caulobacter sp. KR2-114 TaxID=3400912 RepID=UPI003BFEC27D